MSKIIREQVGAGIGEWLKRRLIPLLTLALVIAITITLYLFSLRNPEILRELENYGYLGIFFICLASNATVILPVPGILVVIPLVVALNPPLVGLVGATGGVIGEITGYIAGYSGRGMAGSTRLYSRVEGWMKRWGAWVIFIFAVTPYLPVDITGMVAGALRFPLWKFLLVCWAGKSLKYIVLALVTAWGFEAILRFFG
ncbi:YqaA family protein [Chloroflexota bacterium]